MTHTRLRVRFWIEVVLALMSAALAVLTLLVPEWIEVVFGVEPDEGSGALEVAVTVVAIAMTLAFSLAARTEWRSHPAPAT